MRGDSLIDNNEGRLVRGISIGIFVWLCSPVCSEIQWTVPSSHIRLLISIDYTNLQWRCMHGNKMELVIDLCQQPIQWSVGTPPLPLEMKYLHEKENTAKYFVRHNSRNIIRKTDHNTGFSHLFWINWKCIYPASTQCNYTQLAHNNVKYSLI